LRDTLDRSGFGMAETIEVLQRSWHVEGQSVRPDHRMVAHTGFLTSARLLGAPAGAVVALGADPVAGPGSPGAPAEDRGEDPGEKMA
jgi:hypothetical protein